MKTLCFILWLVVVAGLISRAQDYLPAAAAPPVELPPINPPAPVVVSVDRHQTHAEVAFTCKAPGVEAFQIMRRFNGAIDLTTVRASLSLKRSYMASTKVETWYFTDKKLDPDKTYTYSVVVFTEDGTSLESNLFEIKPTP